MCSLLINFRFKPIKAQWHVYVPPVLTASNSAFFMYLFCMILSVNSYYFLIQH